MHYSCPYEMIGKEVDARVTDSAVEVFYKQNRIACHKRLYGRKGQYSTVPEHMPEKHQLYQEWNGDRFRQWGRKVGVSTYKVIESILASKAVEEQTYLACRSLLKQSDTYSSEKLEEACRKACQFSQTPSYKSVRTILTSMNATDSKAACDDSCRKEADPHSRYGITRGAGYYGGKDDAE